MSDKEASESVSSELLFPDLLSEERLKEILSERQITKPGLHRMSKAELVALCHQSVPQPQRKYRINRRGRLQTRNQIILAKRKRTHDEISAPSYQYMKSGHTQDKFSSSVSSKGNVGDRLKPPPSAINPDRKTIKLGSKRPSSATTDCSNRITFSTDSHKPGGDRLKPAPVSDRLKPPPVHNNGEKTSNDTTTHNSDGAKMEVDSSPTQKPVTPPVCTPARKIKINRSSSTSIKSPETTTSPVSCTTQVPLPKIAVEETKSDKEEDEDGVIRKKFKKINVSWP